MTDSVVRARNGRECEPRLAVAMGSLRQVFSSRELSSPTASDWHRDVYRTVVGLVLAVGSLISACADSDQTEQSMPPQSADQNLDWQAQLAELSKTYAHLEERWDAFVELALAGEAGWSSEQSLVGNDPPVRYLADLLEGRPTPSAEILAELTASFDALYPETMKVYAEIRAIVSTAATVSASEGEELQQSLQEIAQAEQALISLDALLERWREVNAYTGKGSP